ncbi:hypothetical protein FA13DRAFT_1787118 [Coprinellus micaceus]|uniref:Large ribosomal subunit protein bL21m n=1 Tax=Coprinellus micaceus TaxID=71717 RepID=A0A4Y7TS48_COPMI|nr:hypothetical protein FA13DRAFT_1787118 [Coprinellus micaceus]
MASRLLRCVQQLCQPPGACTPPQARQPAHSPLIRAQPSQYVVASFVGKKYILTPRDLLTVPRLRDVRVGDVLALDAIHELGSRDYTLRGTPTIAPERVSVQATVVEHTKGSMEVKFKKKRRKGYQKTIKHKHPVHPAEDWGYSHQPRAIVIAFAFAVLYRIS